MSVDRDVSAVQSLGPVDIASYANISTLFPQCYNWIMNYDTCLLTALTDQQLLHEVEQLSTAERGATARLIASLAELDARRLYLAEGYSSLFVYCTTRLHLSEHAAYGRIEAARVARRVPAVLERIADGSITLTNLCLLAPHLTIENCDVLLAAARFKSKRDIERQVAALRPRPDAPSIVRRLPAPTVELAPQPVDVGLPQKGSSGNSPLLPIREAGPASGSPARDYQSIVTPVQRPKIEALAPTRYKMQFTISEDTHAKFRRVQALIRHSTPIGDPALIFDRALTLLQADLERRQLGSTTRPRRFDQARTHTRHVPAHVRREVWARDEGQCRFIGSNGRCAERGFLELHHLEPFAVGGPTTIANLELRCRAHNMYEADLFFRQQVSVTSGEEGVSDGLGLDRVDASISSSP